MGNNFMWEYNHINMKRIIQLELNKVLQDVRFQCLVLLEVTHLYRAWWIKQMLGWCKLPYSSEKQIVKLWCHLTCFQLFHFWTFWQNSFDPLYFFRLSHNVRCVCVCAHRFSNFWTLNLRYLQFVVPFPSFSSNKSRLDGATSQPTKSDLWWSWHLTDSYNATFQ